MATEEEHHYVVHAEGDRYVVRDEAGNSMCRCRTEPDAAQYAALLNRAFRAGFKAGYRSGKIYRDENPSG